MMSSRVRLPLVEPKSDTKANIAAVLADDCEQHFGYMIGMFLIFVTFKTISFIPKGDVASFLEQAKSAPVEAFGNFIVFVRSFYRTKTKLANFTELKKNSSILPNHALIR